VNRKSIFILFSVIFLFSVAGCNQPDKTQINQKQTHNRERIGQHKRDESAPNPQSEANNQTPKKTDKVESNREQPPKEIINSVPQFIPERCIECGVCAKVCPENAIEMFDGKPVIDSSKCIGCATCAQRCPVKALVMPE